jgi:hypothetical protein
MPNQVDPFNPIPAPLFASRVIEERRNRAANRAIHMMCTRLRRHAAELSRRRDNSVLGLPLLEIQHAELLGLAKTLSRGR